MIPKILEKNNMYPAVVASGQKQDNSSDSPPATAAATTMNRDEWVAQIDARRQPRRGVAAKIVAAWTTMPSSLRYALIVALALAFPLLTSHDALLGALGLGNNAFILRTAVRFFTFAILACGLTVVVGYAGLLDLGYIAFMGLAGYFYAYLSSEFVQIAGVIPYGLAVPSWISVPLIVGVVAAIGCGIGAISIRLSSDYLTIVTLGFGQLFLQLALTMTRVTIPGRGRPVDFTHGPNGITHLDNIKLFGYEFTSTLDYYYLFFVLLVSVYLLVHHLNHSRIGRWWRALREDELAAEVMGIPTRRLKLLAFAIGAAIAALAGSVDAAFQGNVAPNPRYSTFTLINLYGMVVLGGVGSLPGAVIGALCFVLLPELLRDVTLAGYLFYGTLLVTLMATLRPWARAVLHLGLTLLGGLLLKGLVNFVMPGFDRGDPPTGSLLNAWVQRWLVIPVDYASMGNVVTGAAVLLLLGALLLGHRSRWHHLLVGVSVYALAFAWETTLATNAAASRILIVGLTLVVLMIKRPQGLLGKMEVKIV